MVNDIGLWCMDRYRRVGSMARQHKISPDKQKRKDGLNALKENLIK